MYPYFVKLPIGDRMRLVQQSSNNTVLSNGVRISLECWTTGTKKSANDFWSVNVWSADGMPASIERYSKMSDAYKAYKAAKRALAE